MAGGYGRGARIPLRDRIRVGLDQSGGSETPEHRIPSSGPGRHCWVSTPVDGGLPRPALLVEWRREGDGPWLGHVVYVAELRPGEWTTVMEWVSADRMTATAPK